MSLSSIGILNSSGTYFGRVRVKGKLIRRSLETHLLSVAKVKLSGFLQDYRRLAINKGESVKAEVLVEIFRSRPLKLLSDRAIITSTFRLEPLRCGHQSKP